MRTASCHGRSSAFPPGGYARPLIAFSLLENIAVGGHGRTSDGVQGARGKEVSQRFWISAAAATHKASKEIGPIVHHVLGSITSS